MGTRGPLSAYIWSFCVLNSNIYGIITNSHYKNGTIFTSASSTSHIYVAIYHYQLPVGLYVSQFLQYARACSAYDQIWIKISCRGFSRCVWRQHFANSVVDIKIESILFIQSSLVKCCTTRFKTILLSRFYTLILATDCPVDQPI